MATTEGTGNEEEKYPCCKEQYKPSDMAYHGRLVSEAFFQDSAQQPTILQSWYFP